MQENTNTASPSVPFGGGSDWESRYTAGDTPWDKGEAHPALVRWLTFQPLTGRILVPGCGSGHDVRAIAKASSDAEVTGLDIAPTASLTAVSHPGCGRETYLTGDFLRGGSFPQGSFEWIFEHTCFCAIPPFRRDDYARSCGHLLPRGGHLLAIFYTNPSHGGGNEPPHGCSEEELERLFGSQFHLALEERTLPTFEGREEREILRLYRRR